MLQRREARSHLIPFCGWTYADYKPGQHHYEIAERLESVARRDSRFLIIVAPPGFGKSELCSIRFPAWYLGNNPSDMMIGASYAEGLAYRNSYAIRGVIQSPEYQELWRHKLDMAGATRWQIEGKTDQRASYIAAGVGGGITGERCHVMVIDDPFKNHEEADSPTRRETVWNWYKLTARPRLLPGGRIVVICTRWHEDDLVGRLLERQEKDPEADHWEILHLKAITDKKSLWPEWYSYEELCQIRASIGSREFESLYQGNPSIAAGNIFARSWWRFIDEELLDSMVPIVTIQVYDTAFKTGAENDYNAGLTMSLTDQGFIVSDLWHEKVQFPELEQVVETRYQRDLPAYVLVEDAASGQSLIQAKRARSKVPIKGVQAKGDKVSRANSITGLVESGRVSLVTAPWNHDFIEELSSFPSGAHDDIVDAFVHGMTFLREYAGQEDSGELEVGGRVRSKWR